VFWLLSERGKKKDGSSWPSWGGRIALRPKGGGKEGVFRPNVNGGEAVLERGKKAAGPFCSRGGEEKKKKEGDTLSAHKGEGEHRRLPFERRAQAWRRREKATSPRKGGGFGGGGGGGGKKGERTTFPRAHLILRRKRVMGEGLIRRGKKKGKGRIVPGGEKKEGGHQLGEVGSNVVEKRKTSALLLSERKKKRRTVNS